LNNPLRYNDPSGNISFEQAQYNAMAAAAMFGTGVLAAGAAKSGNTTMSAAIASVQAEIAVGIGSRSIKTGREHPREES